METTASTTEAPVRRHRFRSAAPVPLRFFLRSSGYSWPNLAALFMRLFAGVMFMQFGIRQIVDYSILAPSFPSVLGMGHEACLTLMILIEIVCSAMIIVGLLTRAATLLPIISMVLAEWHILHDLMQGWGPASLDSIEPGYVPILFIGMFMALLISGPGKISVDYLLSLRIIQNRDLSEKELDDED